MRIVNDTKSELISADACPALSFFSRARGLMLSPPRDMVLVSPGEDIRSCEIHMLCMRYPIDVIWVDSEKKVVDTLLGVPALSPFKPGTWKTYKPKKPAKYVIELGVGKMGRTEEGDVIQFLETHPSESFH